LPGTKPDLPVKVATGEAIMAVPFHMRNHRSYGIIVFQTLGSNPLLKNRISNLFRMMDFAAWGILCATTQNRQKTLAVKRSFKGQSDGR
jgi:hypothetical protein